MWHGIQFHVLLYVTTALEIDYTTLLALRLVGVYWA